MHPRIPSAYRYSGRRSEGGEEVIPLRILWSLLSWNHLSISLPPLVLLTSKCTRSNTEYLQSIHLLDGIIKSTEAEESPRILQGGWVGVQDKRGGNCQSNRKTVSPHFFTGWLRTRRRRLLGVVDQVRQMTTGISYLREQVSSFFLFCLVTVEEVPIGIQRG